MSTRLLKSGFSPDLYNTNNACCDGATVNVIRRSEPLPRSCLESGRAIDGINVFCRSRHLLGMVGRGAVGAKVEQRAAFA